LPAELAARGDAEGEMLAGKDAIGLHHVGDAGEGGGAGGVELRKDALEEGAAGGMVARITAHRRNLAPVPSRDEFGVLTLFGLVRRDPICAQEPCLLVSASPCGILVDGPWPWLGR
jgi:hypothetical protein